MTTAAFITIFPDIPRIITALAEWLACLVCILSTGRRITGMRLAAVSVCFLAVQSVYMTVTDGFEGVAWNLCMAGRCPVHVSFHPDMCGNHGECRGMFLRQLFYRIGVAASFAWQIWCYIDEMFSPACIFLGSGSSRPCLRDRFSCCMET